MIFSWNIADKTDQCKLIGPFALFVQVCLGLLALSSLVLKRFREYPNRRPWKIWFFDVSKQVFGSLGIHMLNVALSIISGNQGDHGGHDRFSLIRIRDYTNGNNRDDGYRDGSKDGSSLGSNHRINHSPGNSSNNGGNNDDFMTDPCNYYFLNILFDTTIGVPILWLMLLMIYSLASKANIQGISSGQYGVPPKISYYLKQLSLYFIGLIFMKLIIYMILEAFPFLVKIADWILSWSDQYENLQLVFVLMIFPLVMNSLQYYLIDNIIQSPEYKHQHQNFIHDSDSDTSHINEIENSQRDKNGVTQGLLGQQEPQIEEGERLS
ncbi:hypothetical protein PACTADRAFT_49845 [Pachysolen tannophilus NRRL Y-2460]|uniref:Vacuolar membrane protein n=1 Tax=Pachysolen tannophilus NRRL Y-2460 TaxID=669874 RepID=A0A1E4TXN4_PACTA|nr:hypothetical protein PACTADRAFT_49845 [Pachysolen tannophilus NRRL Y-2460]